MHSADKTLLGDRPWAALHPLTRSGRHGSLLMSYLYTLTDTERERAHVQALFDKLMETPEGRQQ